MLIGILARTSLELSRPQPRGVRLQLANTLLLGGDYASALPQYENLIADVAPERGPEDPDVLAWQVQAAICRDALGQSQEALAQLGPVLDIQRRRLGELDPEVVELRRHIALLRASSDQARRALADLRALMAELGPRHPETAEIAEIIHRLGG